MSSPKPSLRVYFIRHPEGRWSGYLMRLRQGPFDEPAPSAYGFSRDEVESKMMPAYLEQGLLKRNPFETIDVDGVGALVKYAALKGRSVKKGLKLGVCGEHGGDPESIALFYEAGLDYVSCSPFRVPIARLAAAQAVIGGAKRDTK